MINLDQSLPLNVGLISSYCTKGIWHSSTFRNFIEGGRADLDSSPNVYPDLYLFMESDVQHWLNKFGIAENRPKSAIRFLSQLTDEQADQLVEGVFSNVDGIPPNAITTFLPELSASKSNPMASLVGDATKNLFRLAVKIGMRFRAENGDSVTTPVVQMVAGNKLDNVKFQHSSQRGRDEFFIVDADEMSSYELVLKRLSESLRELEKEFDSSDLTRSAFGKLRIAFELEPGPLYLLDGPESVKRLCELVDAGGENSCPLVQQKVGFNLDIAHWWLKGIQPSFLAANPKVARRVFHSHISGHSARAHFGDISLTELSIEEKATFVKWLVAISELNTETFSGSVSLEFEAAPNPQAVIDSLNQLIAFVTAPGSFLADAQSA